MSTPSESSRFQIRPLHPSHIPFARTLLTHPNIFHSPVWSVLYPTAQTAHAYAFYTACKTPITLNTATGLSYGLFDTHYVFKNPEKELLEQMDFPLVSIAMAHDAAEPRDNSEWVEVINVIPRLATLFGEIEKLDEREESIWKPKETGQVIYRRGTSTRADYEGLGCAKMLAHWCMGEWKRRGYRGMQLGVAHKAVERIFTVGLPEGMKGEAVARLDTEGYEEVGEDGERVKPFEKVVGDVPCVRVWVDFEWGVERGGKGGKAKKCVKRESNPPLNLGRVES
ncbi:hypothetical protein B0T14DRAFT_561863 [Immersiella caudata]|uniref:Uncharacterized protein n=1 Tax=Immersiella caudata TaxID=314043 RepID=A0AA39X250_9PEZI|nr:hypothetical protein B0T14DRAFT_561863 [Immersiella caudata]